MGKTEHIKDNLRRLEEFPMLLTMQTRNTLLDEIWLFIEELLKQNENLTKRSDWLYCLEEAGVDNWSGIEYAQELREDRKI